MSLVMPMFAAFSFLGSSPAHATTSAPVSVSAASDGRVTGVMVLSVDPGKLEDALADGVSLAESSPEVRSATLRQVGACQHLTLDVGGWVAPLLVETVRCRTSNGWSERLRETGAFSSWDSRWTVEPLADGRSKVQLSVRTELTIPVPRSLTMRRAKDSVRKSLEDLAVRVAE